MYFFVEDDEPLQTNNNIQNRLSNSIKKVPDCEPIYNKRFLTTKIMDENYYRKVFLREYKYTDKKCLNKLPMT